MVIRRGEIYWADLGEPVGSSPGYRHRCFNRSRKHFQQQPYSNCDYTDAHLKSKT
jgi:mRNA-degrading endonuclease toxin of MazEF toxin-antitoxin module